MENMNRCLQVECVCCCEIERVQVKKGEAGNKIDHEGFEPVCMNVWVLQAAYFNYRQRYGEVHEADIHE